MASSNRRLPAAAALVVITIAAFMVFVTIPASAQTGRTAVCIERGSLATLGHTGSRQVQIWMNQQIAQGKTQFFSTDRESVLCAW